MSNESIVADYKIAREVIYISEKTMLPNKNTKMYDTLVLIALFGELPVELLSRICASTSYKESIIKRLRRQGLIKYYNKDGYRGLRPTTIAKNLLFADNPERFFEYTYENVDTNHVRSEPSRRERLHRIAEASVTMRNAGVEIFHDCCPPLPSLKSTKADIPAFYTSREIKDLGIEFDKIKGTRSVGALFTENDIFITYNLGKSIVRKWAYKTEMRTKAVIENEFCLKPQIPHYSCDSVKGIVLSNSMEMAYNILTDTARQYFVLDKNYDNFYFITNDEKGEQLLRLLCRPDLCEELDEILMEDLYIPYSNVPPETDAVTKDGIPVLIAYKCDLGRIRRFDTSLAVQRKKGIVYCFDYQAEILRRYCGETIEFQTLDYNKVERRFFYSTSEK